jgi:hypothetical protein
MMMSPMDLVVLVALVVLVVPMFALLHHVYTRIPTKV